MNVEEQVSVKLSVNRTVNGNKSNTYHKFKNDNDTDGTSD